MNLISTFITFIGSGLIATKDNYFIYILGLEIIFLGVNINVIFNYPIAPLAMGLCMCMLILAAIEAAIGLGLVIKLNKETNRTDMLISKSVSNRKAKLVSKQHIKNKP